MQPGDLVLGLVASTSSAVSIQIVGVPWAQGVLINYITEPANKPKTFHNQLYVWETTGNQVPWDKPADGSAEVSSDSSSSTQPLTFDYEQKGYIFGYAVAGVAAAVCATIYIPQGASGDPTQWEHASVDLKVVYADSSVIQLQYTVLPAYRPLTDKNWVAVWQGSSVPFEGPNSLGSVNIGSDAEQGYAVIAGLSLATNSTYSVGYFMVDQATGRTALAAQASFTLGSK